MSRVSVGLVLLLAILAITKVCIDTASADEQEAIAIVQIEENIPDTDPLATAVPQEQALSSSGESSFGWLIAALAGIGLAAVAAFGALRLRVRRT